MRKWRVVSRDLFALDGREWSSWCLSIWKNRRDETADSKTAVATWDTIVF